MKATALYRVRGYIGEKYFEVEIAAEGIADAIDLSVKHNKRSDAEEMDIHEIKRIDEYN